MSNFLLFLIFLFAHCKGNGINEICSPEKCYNDVRDAISQLKALNLTPQFNTAKKDPEFFIIQDLIKKLKDIIEELSDVQKSLPQIIEDLQNISGNLTINVTEFDNLEKLNIIIDDIIKAIKKLEEDKIKFKFYFETCTDAKNKFTDLSKDFERLQDVYEKLNDTFLYTDLFNDIQKNATTVRKEIDFILESTPIGIEYSCQVLEQKFKDVRDKVIDNKNILKELIKDFERRFKFNKLKHFVDDNEPMVQKLKMLLEYFADEIPQLEPIEKKMNDLFLLYSRAADDKLKQIRDEINKNITRYKNFHEDMFGKIPYIREEIKKLKEIKIISETYNMVDKELQQLRVINESLSYAYCKISNKPEQ